MASPPPAARLAKLLAKRALSVESARARLSAWGCSPDQAGAVINELIAKGFLDDRRSAESFARAALARGAIAPALLQAKLVAQGIAEDLSAQVVSGAVADADRTPAEAAQAFARSALARLPAKLSPAAKARRIAGQLARRGYDEAVVEAALAGLALPADE